MTDYLYHLMMRRTTSEFALFILFNSNIMAHMPLGRYDRLGNPNFEVPISFIMGEFDWIQYLDVDDETGLQGGEKIVLANKIKHGNKSRFYWIPYSGHNLENSAAFLNILIEDLSLKKIENPRAPLSNKSARKQQSKQI